VFRLLGLQLTTRAAAAAQAQLLLLFHKLQAAQVGAETAVRAAT
jgi:hypothetical protein